MNSGDADGRVETPGPPPSDIIYPSAIPFVMVHLACFAAIWTGVDWPAVAIGVGLYWLRIFAIGAGYHRYFSHRAFETGRAFRFALAFFSQSSAQRSVLWWAAKHREHHLHSDTPQDVHSPRQMGLVYSHVGWIFDRRHADADFSKIGDLTRIPELRWLHRYELAPAVLLALACFAVAGWQGLVIGFFWSTVAVYHATFSINSIAHVRGRQRYVTGDYSRNNWFLALITMGEGWHNNHHAYQSSGRQGFFWWEYDPTYYLLLALERAGVVRGLRSPPVDLVENRQRLGARVVRRAAEQVAARFNAAQIANAAAGVLGSSRLAVLHLKFVTAQIRASDVIRDLNLPGIPGEMEIRRCARSVLANSPSIEDIVVRAHHIVLEAIGARLAVLAARAAEAA